MVSTVMTVPDTPVQPQLFQRLYHGDDIIIFGFFEEQVDVGKVFGQQQAGIAHEIEDVPEHLTVAIDEVVLLQTVQYDGNTSAEHLSQPRFAKLGESF